MEAYADVIAKWPLNGLVVGVLRDGEIELRTFGVSSLETGAPVNGDTAFGIGSISKVFATTVAMQLVDAGTLDLDTPVLHYLPDLPLPDPEARQRLTMRHLLTHRGGFEGDALGGEARERTLAEYVSRFHTLPQFLPPGERWSYCNTGFGLAGRVIEVVSGRPYEELLRTALLEPLGLTRTKVGQPPELPDTATGYDFGEVDAPEVCPAYTFGLSSNPIGGVISTAPDLIRFAQFHMGLLPGYENTVLSDSARKQMQQTQAEVSGTEAWGLGWGKRLVRPGVWAITHSGWANGFRAQLTLLPEISAAYVMLTNSPRGHAGLEELNPFLVDELLGPPPAEPAFAVPHRETLVAYAGRYTNSQLDVTVSDPGVSSPLLIDVTTQWHGNDTVPRRSPLRPAAPDEFDITEGEFAGGRIIFFRDHSGAISSVRVLHRLCQREK